MKIFQIVLFPVIFILSSITFSQVETVPIHNTVYTFLKEMKVKGLLSFIREDDPILSRFEVKDLLNQVKNKENELSNTERKFLEKYQVEFFDSVDPDTATQLFKPQNSFFNDLDQMFTDKVKYLYAYKEPDVNVYMEWLGHFYHG